MLDTTFFKAFLCKYKNKQIILLLIEGNILIFYISFFQQINELI